MTIRTCTRPVRELLVCLLTVVGVGHAAEDQVAAQQVPGGGVPQPIARSLGQEEAGRLEGVLQEYMSAPCDMVFAAFNEIHDCQRLILVDPITQERRYGPLVGIFPDPGLHDLTDASFEVGVPVARVTNAGSESGPGGYGALGISNRGAGDSTMPDGYCLWIRSRPEWSAALVPTAERGTPACGSSPPAEWPLTVVRQRYGQAPAVRYPDTARLHWSSASNVQYYGVKCGDAWCVVGARGFVPRRMPQPSEEADARRAIPGWHDAQFLAVLAADSTTLIPGPWGEVYPPVQLPAAIGSDYQTVASIRVVPVPPPGNGVRTYDKKFNLAPFPFYSSVIQLRDTGTPSDPVFDARYDNGFGVVVPARLVNYNHGKHGVTGSARFQWRNEDESVWVPCRVYGCCEVEEEGG